MTAGNKPKAKPKQSKKRRVRGLSLVDAIELSLRVRRGALEQLAKR